MHLQCPVVESNAELLGQIQTELAYTEIEESRHGRHGALPEFPKYPVMQIVHEDEP